MTSKLWFLTKTSLIKKMGSKWFYIANILLCIAIVGLINIDTIINSFGGDFNEKTSIIVFDETDKFYDLFESEYNSNSSYLGDMSKTEISLYDKTLDEAKKEVEENKKLLVVISEDETNYISAKIISKNEMDGIVLQTLTTSLNNAKTTYALALSDIDIEKLNNIYKPVTLEKEYLEEVNDVDEAMTLIMGTVFPIIILPFFMLTLFLVQMIGAEVNEEKTTKGMEIIISNVSPKTHFYSKVLAGNIFVLTQGLLLIVFAILGIVLRVILSGSLMPSNTASEVTGMISMIATQLDNAGILSSLAYVIPLTLILMVVNFVLYSLLAGILASITTNIEDFQQLQTPIMLISMSGYMLSTMAPMFEGSIFIRLVSYIPFISPLLSPSLLVMGQIGIIDVVISILLTIVFIFVFTKYGLRIYKVGILNYSSTGLWKKMFKAIKEEKV